MKLVYSSPLFKIYLFLFDNKGYYKIYIINNSMYSLLELIGFKAMIRIY